MKLHHTVTSSSPDISPVTLSVQHKGLLAVWDKVVQQDLESAANQLQVGQWSHRLSAPYPVNLIQIIFHYQQPSEYH